MAVLPSRSHARSRMTREEEPLAREAGADLLNWRGVPVKADAIEAIKAARRRGRAMADFMVVAFCDWFGGVISFSIEAMVGRYSKTGFTGDTDEREPSINIG